MKEIENKTHTFFDNNDTQYEVKFDGENIWMSEKQLSDLFEVSKSEILRNIKSIFKTKELYKDFVTTVFAEKDGRKMYINQFYNQEMISLLGLRLNIAKLTEFKVWSLNLFEKEEIITTAFSSRQAFYA